MASQSRQSAGRQAAKRAPDAEARQSAHLDEDRFPVLFQRLLYKLEHIP